MLIGFGGFPASCETTLARALAQQLSVLYRRIDTIEQATRSQTPGSEIGATGNGIPYRIAAGNLKLCRSVVADSVDRCALVDRPDSGATDQPNRGVRCATTTPIEEGGSETSRMNRLSY